MVLYIPFFGHLQKLVPKSQNDIKFEILPVEKTMPVLEYIVLNAIGVLSIANFISVFFVTILKIVNELIVGRFDISIA